MNQIRAIFLCFILFYSYKIDAKVSLPSFISKGAVLQHGEEVNIWGWATDEKEVTAYLNNKKTSTALVIDGSWTLKLPPQMPGGPHILEIRGTNKITLEDIYFGDVWIAAGQSNMEMTLQEVSRNYPKVLTEPAITQIRQFRVPKESTYESPRVDVIGGNWQHADDRKRKNFSAIAYFFAKEIYQQYNIPIGIINTSYGGSRVEGWMSETTLEQFPQHLAKIAQYRIPGYLENLKMLDKQANDYWTNNLNNLDLGLNESLKWYEWAYKDNDWESTSIPCGVWRKNVLEELNGAVWLRKSFNINDSKMLNQESILELGRIINSDITYINGVKVGETSYQYPQRRYNIPAGTLKLGKNQITVRVVIPSGKGGFLTGKPYQINFANKKLSLEGTWKYKIGARVLPKISRLYKSLNSPLGFYNAMLAPILPYNIKGVIWYQGESNIKNAKEYKSLFPELIRNWRKDFGQGEFPFLFVQLPSYLAPFHKPTESDWAELRHAQTQALKLPNTGMAVSIDTGEWNDIHPLDKKPIGQRLALIARRVAYREDNLITTGPLFKSLDRVANRLFITFEGIGDGLKVKDGTLQYFEIASDTSKYLKAKAQIFENKVVVWHDELSQPTKVRYAWANNPVGANLYNNVGLPAAPFEAEL